ncbi:hypothetical protein RMSM_02632 [Rhodopirellula maiorica SM1]|uniref:Uncharacterized protein n=1 Tax=Rhodopirellula maiorica SM1 TaxID=1265738 RepID=M5RYI4_9BACT|nr:hypothetical protein RMSM_02632 [Rhodopirellula maiorica SM1]
MLSHRELQGIKPRKVKLDSHAPADFVQWSVLEKQAVTSWLHTLRFSVA